MKWLVFSGWPCSACFRGDDRRRPRRSTGALASFMGNEATYRGGQEPGWDYEIETPGGSRRYVAQWGRPPREDPPELDGGRNLVYGKPRHTPCSSPVVRSHTGEPAVANALLLAWRRYGRPDLQRRIGVLPPLVAVWCSLGAFAYVSGRTPTSYDVHVAIAPPSLCRGGGWRGACWGACLSPFSCRLLLPLRWRSRRGKRRRRWALRPCPDRLLPCGARGLDELRRGPPELIFPHRFPAGGHGARGRRRSRSAAPTPGSGGDVPGASPPPKGGTWLHSWQARGVLIFRTWSGGGFFFPG